MQVLLERYIRSVRDFPKKGIVFRDITPLLADARALRYACSTLANAFRSLKINLLKQA